MDILGASGSEAFSIFCYCEGSENPFYGVFIQCVVKPLASAMGFYDASIEFMQVIEDGQNSNCIN